MAVLNSGVVSIHLRVSDFLYVICFIKAGIFFMAPKNRLANETSPYLLQHASNPVDWYPWGEEALQKAKRENKPILLSIGYSACHWCHVMAHESFSDIETSKLMNELFVNIKVDREERPDLDRVYQIAYQLLMGKTGGWPLTAFLTPDQQIPYFIGTYFPKEPQYQLPAFKNLLHYMAAAYHQQQGNIEQQNQSLINAFKHLGAEGKLSLELNMQPLANAKKELEMEYDPIYGGFGGVQKFPRPTQIEFLFKQWCEAKRDAKTFNMIENTLTKMAQGGIYDQIGGGFYRYTVDEKWEIPHFEKMLYDNAQLLVVYTQIYQVTRNELYKKILIETAQWVMREMQSVEGGYYSSLNADSEGKEGQYYVWSEEELRQQLTASEYEIVHEYYNLHHAANFEGFWHLHVTHSIAEIAKKFDQPFDKIEQTIDLAKQKMFNARKTRIKPSRDEKNITGWNALMIKGMALTGVCLNRMDFIISAERAFAFIQKNLWKNTQLLASYKDGRAHLNAYLDDYVFLIDAILSLLQARLQSADLLFAQQLADIVLAQFEDQEKGGFFFTANDHETLIYRPKNLMDEALPAGNGIAARVLLRLGFLLEKPTYITAAEKTLKMAWPALTKFSSSHCGLLLALMELEHGLKKN